MADKVQEEIIEEFSMFDDWLDKYDYLIVNDDLQTCVEEMHQIIQGEHRRSFRNKEFIDRMKEELKGE